MMQNTSTDNAKKLAGRPFFFRQVCKILGRIKYGRVALHLPDGEVLHFSGTDELDQQAIIYARNYAFARRTIFGGAIGFFESYAAEEWDTPDLAQSLYVFARNVDYLQEAFHAAPFINVFNAVRHALNQNSKKGSKKNIVAHYDLGNQFYEKWLDGSMTYSSALYATPTSGLKSAQENKYAALANDLRLTADDHILEIGSGWGGFAEYAAKERGARITGLTLSPAQLEFAQKRIFEAGLAERVKFELRDYRDVDGAYDGVASIEMFEAVGREYWATYFDKVKSVLKPGGAAGLQIITIDDRYFNDYIRFPDFIQRYVFPGGVLPSPNIVKNLTANAGLSINHIREFGQDYARTLNEWHSRFCDAWNDIQPLGFDERFRKLWKFYLAYCEAGFRAATTNVCQISLKHA